MFYNRALSLLRSGSGEKQTDQGSNLGFMIYRLRAGHLLCPLRSLSYFIYRLWREGVKTVVKIK